MRAIGNWLRHNLTTRLILLLVLALMVITGINDYTRLVSEREQLVTQTREDERIFAETLALAVRYNLRRGRTTEELEGLLEEIVARPGLAAVVIYDPDAGVVARTFARLRVPTADDLRPPVPDPRGGPASRTPSGQNPALRAAVPVAEAESARTRSSRRCGKWSGSPAGSAHHDHLSACWCWPGSCCPSSS
jgi:hypothetical protein